MSIDHWTELYDDISAVVLGREGTITLCHWENRDRGSEKIGEPIIKLEQVPDLVDAAYRVAVAYGDPTVKPMELKTIIDKLVEVLEEAGYRTKVKIL